MPLTWFLGLRYLQSKQKKSFISLITLLSVMGIALGVMALVVVIAVMTGFESELQRRILSMNSHILVMPGSAPLTDADSLITTIESVPGVESAIPFIYAQVMLRSAHGVTGSVIKALDPEKSGPQIAVMGDRMLADVLKDAAPNPSEKKIPGLVIGKVTAKTLQVDVGDPIFLFFPMGQGGSQLPDVKRFSVAGIFEMGINEYDGIISFARLDVIQDLVEMPGEVTGIQVEVADIYKAPQMTEAITQKTGTGFWVRDWIQMNQSLFSMLRLQKTVMFIILTMIVLVAAFNIASTLIMMVMEKTKDIAILTTMGATRRHIRQIFIFEGLVIGFIGSLIGGCLGVILCGILRKYPFIHLPGDVYFLTTLPVSFNIMDVMTIALCTMLICFLATVYPAVSASSLDPVEGIRYG
ncbi:ABC transporter permease [Desulfosarcina sp. OttesenSCG-928-G17]|nr:ABC transporter permease [Desulfosarcina sp. OttesenSCG-928-G17]